MSWGVSGIGKPAALAVSIEKQFSGYQCSEPEETVRQSAKAAIAAALAAQAPDTAVSVIASGSQGYVYDAAGKDTGKRTNNLIIRVEPQGAFLE